MTYTEFKGFKVDLTNITVIPWEGRNFVKWVKYPYFIQLLNTGGFNKPETTEGGTAATGKWFLLADPAKPGAA